jgi:hypothetical protein
LFVISGKLSIPALGSLIIREQVPQPRLAERASEKMSSAVRLYTHCCWFSPSVTSLGGAGQ